MGLKWLWFCLVTAAAFFVTYDCTKSLLGAGGGLAAPQVAPVTHMLAASLGEIVSPPICHSLNFYLLSLRFSLLSCSTVTAMVNCWPDILQPVQMQEVWLLSSIVLFHALVLLLIFPPHHFQSQLDCLLMLWT